MSKIDTTLQPSPTGAAATLAAAHSEGGKPITLYGGWFCPFVQRAWIVLEEKRVSGYQYVEINPYRKEEGFLRLNPRGLVPTLVFSFSSSSSQDGDDGDEGKGKKEKKGVLYESMVICEFLDELVFPSTTSISTSTSTASDNNNNNDENNNNNGDNENEDETPALLPRGNDGPITTFQRARCRLWIDHVASRIVPGFYKLLQCDSGDALALTTARKQFLDALKAFVREMMTTSSDSNEGGGGGHGPWFLGEKFSLVDVMLAPWAMRLFLIDYYKPGGVGIPPPARGQQQQQGKGEGKGDENEDEDEDEAAVWERWHVWFEAVKSRKSVRDTWSDDEEYVKAYKRYADDTTQSEVGKATRRGERLP